VERIEQEYTVNWILDGLPAAVRMYEEGSPEKVHLERGACAAAAAAAAGLLYAARPPCCRG
jgi:hypothetical protein